MCTVILPPADNPIAVNKYIISHNKNDWEATPVFGQRANIAWTRIILVLHIPTVWIFPGGKVRPGRDTDPSPPSSAVVKTE